MQLQDISMESPDDGCSRSPGSCRFWQDHLFMAVTVSAGISHLELYHATLTGILILNGRWAALDRLWII